MNVLIIDIYGDGDSLRVCEDIPGVDQIIAEFQTTDGDEDLDESMQRKEIQLLCERRINLHNPWSREPRAKEGAT